MGKAIHFQVEEELYKQIKVKIALDGITLKDYVISLIKADLSKDEK